MRVLIVSNHEPIGSQVREALLREGGYADVAAPGLAVAHLRQAHPDLVVVVLSPEPERTLGVLGELRSVTRARVFAVGPTADPKLVLRALRAGADDYLDEAEVVPELEAALARRRAAEEPAEAGAAGEVIAVLGSGGGSGASTLAANVATVLAQAYERSVLVDLKLETGDLAALLDLTPTHTLADLCQHAAHMDRIMFERSLVRHASGVHLLAPPRSFADIATVTPEGIGSVMGLARSLFPHVVVDLGHPSRPEQMQVLRQTDVILLVMRLDFTSLRNAQRVLDYLGQSGVNLERVRLVVNRYGQAKEIPAAKAEEALGRKVFHYVPDDPRTVNRDNNNGVPAVLVSPSARVSRSLAALVRGLGGGGRKAVTGPAARKGKGACAGGRPPGGPADRPPAGASSTGPNESGRSRGRRAALAVACVIVLIALGYSLSSF